MWPGDSYFSPDARVSGLCYQLGLDRNPELETRNPRVLHGDPGLCQLLETTNRLANRSTNFSINWSEKITDREAAEIGRHYVEEVLLVGVPPSRYAYSLIAHDEQVREGPDESLAHNRNRTSVHGKIINTRFPGGGYLQPMYSPRDRMITTLYFARMAIERNWSHPLDPERSRNVASHHVHGPITKFRRIVVEAAASASRLPSGEPDSIALLKNLEQVGISDIYATKGLHGKPGIYVRLDDHPRRIRFFGAEFGALNEYINNHEKPENEHQRCPNNSLGETCFPGGYLDRSAKYTSRILFRLNQLTANRAEFNRQRYRIDFPALAVGGLDIFPAVGMGVHFGLASGQIPGYETGLAQRRALRSASTSSRAQPAKITQGHTDEEPANPRKPPGTKRDTHLRGDCTHLGALVAAIVANTASGVRAVHQSAQRTLESVGRCIQETERGTTKIAAAARRLNDAGCLLGSAARELDRAPEYPRPRALLMPDFPASSGVELVEAEEEYLLRARRPRPPLREPQIRPSFEMRGL